MVRVCSSAGEWHMQCRVRIRTWPLVGLLAILAGVGDSLATSLQGSEWQAVYIRDNGVTVNPEAFVQFRGEGRLEGHGGCNRLFAEYRASGDRLTIGPVALTRTACARSLMAFEAALAAALEAARSYRRVHQELVLFDKDGSPVLGMRQTDWD